ncbi:MAG: hypothetical protein ABI903_10300 [Actinomycetota bacterium]
MPTRTRRFPVLPEAPGRNGQVQRRQPRRLFESGAGFLRERANRLTPTSRWVLGIAGLLILIQLLLRTWVAARGYFYWDDLILTSRSGSMPLLSTDFLLFDHDGHFMPGAFLVAGLITKAAPLQWIGPVVSLVVMQALASLSVLRLLRVLMGDRVALLAPLVFYLFSPLTLPSFAWWSAALNDLPLQLALAWVTCDAILLVRTGNRRHAVTGVIAFALSLAFFEKAVVVPWVAFAVVALVLHIQGEHAVLRTVVRRAAPLWRGALLVTVGWVLLYTGVVTSRAAQYSADQAVVLIWRGFGFGFVPSLLGGPWGWDQSDFSVPWATPPLFLVVLGLLTLLGAVVLTIRRKQRVAGVWLLLAGYVGVSLAAMVVGRAGPYTAQVLGQTLRYVADSAVVVSVAMALILSAPGRGGKNGSVLARASAKATLWRWRARTALGLVVAVAFLASSVFSTVTFTRTWSYSPTAVYLATVRASLAANHVAPLLDQPISNRILWRLANPYNLGSRIFSPVAERADFVSSTPILQRLDDSGHIVPAQMKTLRTAAIGPLPRCGYQVTDLGFTNMPLDGGLIHFGWTVHFGYLTSVPGSLEVALETGPSVIVPVSVGLNQVFVNLEGNGTLVRVRSHTRGMVACVAGAVVGIFDHPGPQP